MNARKLFTFRNPHFTVSVGLTVGLLLVTALVGFIVLPFAQRDQTFASVWDAICSAAGRPRATQPGEAAPSGAKTSEAVLTSTTLAHPSQQSIGRGATLAQRCLASWQIVICAEHRRAVLARNETKMTVASPRCAIIHSARSRRSPAAFAARNGFAR